MKFSFPSSPGLKKPARITLGILFIIASTFHFTASDIELKIIPPSLPWRRAALFITGILELLGGIGVLIPRFQKAAGKGLAAFPTDGPTGDKIHPRPMVLVGSDEA